MDSPPTAPPTQGDAYFRERIQFLEQLLHSKEEEINQLKGDTKGSTQIQAHPPPPPPQIPEHSSVAFGPGLNENESSSSSSSSVNAALSSPVILGTLLTYTSAKESRLVCRAWNGVLLSLPRPTLPLNLLLLIHSGALETETDLSHLARSITVWPYELTGLPRAQVFETLGQFLPTFCARFTDTIRILKIHGDEGLFTKVHTILEHSCPHISELNLTWVRAGAGEGVAVGDQVLAELPSKPGLKYVRIRQCLGRGVPPAFSICQSILNSAPGLEMLILETPTFPELGANTSLKVLKCCLHLGQMSGFHTYMKALSRGLGSVSNSLQVLKLSSNTDNFEDESVPWLPRGERRQHFTLPRLPNLKKFSNWSPQIFQLLPNRDDISARNFPHLEILKVCANLQGVEEVEESLVRWTDPGSNFQSGARILELCWVSSLEHFRLLRRLRTPFPELEELVVSMDYFNWTRDGEVMDENDRRLPLLVGACCSLGLKRVTIGINCGYRFCRLLSAVWESRQGLEGLKSLKIRNTADCEEDLDVDEQMVLLEKVLLLSRNMEEMTFHAFRLKCRTSERMFNFIRHNGLPVYFK